MEIHQIPASKHELKNNIEKKYFEVQRADFGIFINVPAYMTEKGSNINRAICTKLLNGIYVMTRAGYYRQGESYPGINNDQPLAQSMVILPMGVDPQEFADWLKDLDDNR